MKPRRTFPVDFQRRIDGESTKMCSLGEKLHSKRVQSTIARLFETPFDGCFQLLIKTDSGSSTPSRIGI